MLIIITFIPLVLMVTLWRRWFVDWRDNLIVAAVLWGGYAVVSTEVLSVLNAITQTGIIIGWSIASAAVIAATIVRKPWREATSPAADSSSPAGEKWILLPQITIIAAPLLLIAWMGPPNNWDSMAYHLPRVIHWIQDGNVAFYPTANARQLEMAPGAEYLILHFYILSQDDHWANLVQYLAYVGCIIAVALVAKLLGGGTRAQVFSATFMATAPMAILESGTTQNDLVCAFWLISFTIFVLHICKTDRASLRPSWFVLCGISLGLALMTKATLYIITAPFCLGMAIIALWRLQWRAVGGLVLVAVIALSMNLPTYVRNYRFSHTFLGNGGWGPAGKESTYANRRLNLSATASNLLRNLGSEAAVPPLVIQRAVEKSVRAIHTWLKIDPDDPHTTMCGTYNLSYVVWNSEDHAPNPFHLLLIMAALATLLAKWKCSARGTATYALAIVAAFLGFCAYLRWQPWGDRLHLPMLAASGAFVGVALERYWKPAVSLSVIGLLPLLATPWIFQEHLHPLTGPDSIFDVARDRGYFAARPSLYDPYRRIVDAAEQHHVKQVVMLSDGNTWEYPLQIMLRQRLPEIRVEGSPKTVWPATALHSGNQGFDANLKPYLVVDLRRDLATAADFVDNH